MGDNARTKLRVAHSSNKQPIHYTLYIIIFDVLIKIISLENLEHHVTFCNLF